MSESYTNQPGQRLDIPDPGISMQGKTMGGSDFKIYGTTLPVLVLNMRSNAHFFSETGSLSWMDAGTNMQTNLGAGGGLGGMLGGMLKRAVTGESLFVVDYTANRDGALAAFSSPFPGKILPINLGPGQTYVAQKGAFLTAEKTVQFGIAFNRKLGSGLFGGEGFILQQFTGPGTFFASFDGELVEYTLAPGEKLRVDTGHVGMFEKTVSYDIEMVKGFKNILFGGEGLFFATLTGPGRVWLQTMPMQKLAGAIMQYMPRAEGPSGTAGGGGVSLGGVIDSLTR